MHDNIEFLLAALDAEEERLRAMEPRTAKGAKNAVTAGSTVVVVQQQRGGAFSRLVILLLLLALIGVGVSQVFTPAEVVSATFAKVGRPIPARLASLVGIPVGGACVDVVDSIAAGLNPNATFDDGSAKYTRLGKNMLIYNGARFHSTGSSAWADQPKGEHGGADVQGKEGTPVVLLVDAQMKDSGRYYDVGRFGDYRRFEANGYSHYLGHMEDAINAPKDEWLPAGTVIGVMTGGPVGVAWGPHVHWQIERVGAVDGIGDIDPEEWWAEHCSSFDQPRNDDYGRYESVVWEECSKFGVPRNIASAIYRSEGSRGDPKVGPNYAGAVGLMQVKQEYAPSWAAQLGMTSYDLKDPHDNAKIGCYVLSKHLEAYPENHAWAYASYNWGPTAVSGFLSRHPEARNMKWSQVLASYGGQIPLETQGYVRSVLAKSGEEDHL